METSTSTTVENSTSPSFESDSTAPQSQSMVKALIILLVAVLLAFGGFTLYSMQSQKTAVAPTIAPEMYSPGNMGTELSESQIVPDSSSTEGWKMYINSSSRFALQHPGTSVPIEKYLTIKSGEELFIITDKLNFNATKLTSCSTSQESVCLIPGNDWYQTQDIQPTQLGGRAAQSFFVSVSDINGGTQVLHVVQTTESPRIEIAYAVDGTGLEEQFQKILSTVEFSE